MMWQGQSLALRMGMRRARWRARREADWSRRVTSRTRRARGAASRFRPRAVGTWRRSTGPLRFPACAVRHGCAARPKAGSRPASAGSTRGGRRRLRAGLAVCDVTSMTRRTQTRGGASGQRSRAGRSGRPVASSATAARGAPRGGDRLGGAVAAGVPGAGGRRVDAAGRRSPPRVRGETEARRGGPRAAGQAGQTSAANGISPGAGSATRRRRSGFLVGTGHILAADRRVRRSPTRWNSRVVA